MLKRDEIDLPAAAATSAAPGGKNYLFVVAVDAYRQGVTPLRNAVRDARELRSILLGQYQFTVDCCYTLLDEAATRGAYDQCFLELNQRLTEEDNLVFYFSGHGTRSEERQQGYWLLHDAVAGDYTTYLPNAAVLSFIKACPARHVYGIVDACFAGTLFRSGTVDPPSRLYHYRSRYLLTAGREERVLDGPAGKNSPFADTLLQQLRDPSRQRIWGEDLARQVLKFIQHQTDEQTPRGDFLKDTRHAGGEMIFLKKEANLPTPIPPPPPTTATEERTSEDAQRTVEQHASKIYNIERIDQAEFN